EGEQRKGKKAAAGRFFACVCGTQTSLPAPSSATAKCMRLGLGEGLRIAKALYDRKPAYIAEQTDVTVLFAPPAAAEVEDTEAADGEVVADGIGAVEFCEAVSERAGGFPIGGFTVVQAEEGGDPVNVGVERHDQFGWVDKC